MIKNIIFDIGGVLIDLEVQKSFNELTKLLGNSATTQKKMHRILDEYEVGAFSEGSFLHRLQMLCPKVVTERDLVYAWNAMLGPMKKERLIMFANLKKRYNLYLLSNTNQTHLQYFHRYLRETHDLENFEELYFVKAYYSHLIRLSKPNPRIYEYVLKDARISAEETIFIDDTLVNVESANKLGLKSIHHDPQNEIVETIEDYIALF